MTLISRKGKLYLDFYHQSKRYKRSLNLDDTKSNRKYAQQRIIPEFIYKLNSGEFFNNEDKIPTVDEFIKISFELHKHERRELTQKSYLGAYNLHIKDTFGDKKIDAIKPSELILWQNRLLDKLSSKKVKSVRTIFNTMFSDAINDEIIEKNPFSRVKSPKNKDVKIRKPFTLEEMLLIIENAKAHIRAFFAIGFLTGMRTGEIIGLKWEDIDFEERIIKVRRARRAGIEDVPKTLSSIRDIEILDELFPYLVTHREIINDASIYLFETREGNPYYSTSKVSYSYWRTVLKQLNLEYRDMYQMRHSFASMMISNGEDILWVSNMLGHKDSSITLKAYAKYIKTPKKKRASFLGQIGFNGNTVGTV